MSDDLEGSVHRRYGMLADPTYLIDADGRVSFYNAMTHAPTLHRAIAQLLRLGGVGVAASGYDRRPHILPVLAAGWPALRRGLPQSAVDLETAMPTTSVLPYLGYQMRELLAPVALRGAPLPAAARIALGVGAGMLAASALSARRRSMFPTSRAHFALNSESESSAKLNEM